MAAGKSRKLGRLVFFLCIALQMPIFPVFQLKVGSEGEGESNSGAVDPSATPEYVSSIQVVFAFVGAAVEKESPELLSAAVLPGALAREAANVLQCKLEVGTCREWPLFDWSDWRKLGRQPPFSPAEMSPRLMATYPSKSRELFAGSLFSLVAALLCVVGNTKSAIFGTGLALYGCLGEGHKLAPWVGVLVSAAVLVSGMLDIKPAARKVGGEVTTAQEAEGKAEPKKDK
eukprot:CAMPEP_0117675574 /NCGR_PEP_ID=MMETSP0804-20121206/15683_1 /TAXON_ID=1074897 /ORGANISM="Tetraselmis astigmatica, Strain CCMP880" /LENGTH=229 /DNA_ID=CAMNT_0005484597 /DNA_START=24 /DNA_END=713 /DNA_ORIENTATION=-